MRVDLVLCRLRLAKTRSAARSLVAAGHIRANGRRVTQVSHPVAEGDILTIPLGNTVTVMQIIRLPDRRGPASEARECYRVLDPEEQSALAEGSRHELKGNRTP